MKKHFYILLNILLFSIWGSVSAQNEKIDSLLSLLKKDKEDTNKVNHFHKLCIEYQKIGDYKTALLDEQQTLLLSQKLKWKKGEAKAYNSIGAINWNQGNYPKALDNYLKAVNIDYVILSEVKNPLEKQAAQKGIAAHLGNIGNVYTSQGDYTKALDYYLKALKIDEELNYKSGMAKRLSNIGVVYDIQGDYPNALVTYFKVLKMKEQLGDKNGIAITLGNIGIVYSEQKEYKTALDYYFKALKMGEKVGDRNGVARYFGNIGSVYVIQNKYKEAYNYLYRALALDDSIGIQDGVKDDYDKLSELYESAKTPLPDSIGGKLLNMERMRLRALYYHKRYISIRDTLFSEENKKQLVRKEMNFEFEKKEVEAKAEQDKKDAIAIADAKRQKIVLVLVSFVLLLVAVAAFIIFRSLRITRKQKTVIEEQKHLVEEKQKEILDSIYYARRIQRSLLPTEKYIEKSLSRLIR